MSAAIEFATVGTKTMADGTLRLTVDIEPRDALAAFTLFRSPGTAGAVAAIRPAPGPAPEPEPAAPMKGGELSRVAAIMCKSVGFFEFVSSLVDDTAEASSFMLCQICGVDQKRELDHNPGAATRFHELIRKPWLELKK